MYSFVTLLKTMMDNKNTVFKIVFKTSNKRSVNHLNKFLHVAFDEGSIHVKAIAWIQDNSFHLETEHAKSFVCFCICLFVYYVQCLPAGQKRASDLTSNGCEPPMWLLGIELRTAGRTASVLNR